MIYVRIFKALVLPSDFEFCATCGVVKLVKFLSGGTLMICLSICGFIFPSQESVDSSGWQDFVIKPVPSVTLYLFLYE